MNAFFKYTSQIALSFCLALGLTFCSSDDSSGGDSATVELAVVVSGQLTDSTTGDPVANATLSVSDSLAVKSGPDKLVTLVTTTTTDANGFYELILEAGAFTHTINITDEDGTELGSIDLTITADNGVGELDTSNAPSIIASVPAITTIDEEPVAKAAVDLAGTYADTEVTASGNPSGETMINIVVNESNQVISGSLRGAYFSADGSQLSIPISGSTLGTVCAEKEDSILECVAENVEIDGSIFPSVELAFNKVSDDTNVPDGTGNISTMTSLGADSFLSSDWGTPQLTYDDADDDKADSTPGTEIDKIYVGTYDSDTIAVFIELTENADFGASYIVTFRNDVYNEIRISIYDPNRMDDGPNTDFTMQYRVNDDSETQETFTPGDKGITWDFNSDGTPSLNNGDTTAIEFWFQLSAIETATINASDLTDVEVEVVAEENVDQGDPDVQSDVAYPFAFYDLFQ